MSTYPIRFGQGRGLELSSAQLTQQGLLRLQNATLDERDVLAKRRGAELVPRTTTADPLTEIPAADLRALWHRGGELLLTTADTLYSRQACADPESVGHWRARGPWTRGLLEIARTADYGADTVAQTAAVRVTNQSGTGACTLQLADVRTGAAVGVQALVYTTHTALGGSAAPSLVLAASRAPWTADVSQTRAAWSVVDEEGVIQFNFWQAGDALTSVNSGLVTHNPAAPVYALDAAQTASGDGFALFVYRALGGGATLVVFNDSLGIEALHDVSLPGLEADAVAVYAVPGPDNVLRVVTCVAAATGVGGGYTFQVRALTITAGVVAPLWDRVSVIAGAEGDLVIATSVIADVEGITTTADVALEIRSVATGERDVKIWEVEPGKAFLRRTYQRAALLATYQALPGSGQWTLGISLVEFLGQRVAYRSGAFLVTPRTGEVVARINALAGDDTLEDYVVRATYRTQVSPLNLYGDALVFGYQTVAAIEQVTTRAKVAVVDLVARPDRPAQIQRTAVSACAGYPRVYDGETTGEQDWHELPRIVNKAFGVGNIAGPGFVGLALTWEWRDAQGNVYRSLPFLDTISLGAGPVSIDVFAPSLTLTERSGVLAVLWRTAVNGTTYYRAGESPAMDASNTVTVSATQADADLIGRGEILDVTTVGSSTACTNWIAVGDLRLWSPDPERPALVRFSSFATEARAVGWEDAFAQELAEGNAAQGLAEGDGRLVAWTSLGVHAWATGGPNNLGVGTYPLPTAIPAAGGTVDFHSLARTPDGWVFGSPAPLLLTRGLGTNEYADAIYAPWERDGERLRLAEWLPGTRQAWLANGDGGRVFRFHRDTQRWGEDTGRSAWDSSVSAAGSLALLADDGRVLVEGPSSPYADGGQKYPLTISTPWIREPGDQALGGYNFIGLTLLGEYRGPHELVVRVYFNFAATPHATVGASAARTAELDAKGLPYAWQWRPAQAFGVHAVRVEIADTGEQNATFALEALDIEWGGDGSSRPVELADEHLLD